MFGSKTIEAFSLKILLLFNSGEEQKSIFSCDEDYNDDYEK